MFSITELIFERTKEAEQGFCQTQNPTVLSCGGIYIPRRVDIQKIQYHILNLANTKEPIKIYTGRRNLTNRLQEILAKEGLN
ncbi:MAG: hypothetical protein HY609_01215 [Deltaproteobacteria bacterium]|nr:hypothetical protein [Deltaproteobacteria bacterium]MBI4223529.1 hypothetical protein [Deltaproteobacteria bacterium]